MLWHPVLKQSTTLVNKPRYRCINLLMLEFKFGDHDAIKNFKSPKSNHSIKFLFCVQFQNFS